MINCLCFLHSLVITIAIFWSNTRCVGVEYFDAITFTDLLVVSMCQIRDKLLFLQYIL